LLSTQYFRDQPPKLERRDSAESGPEIPKKVKAKEPGEMDAVSGAILDEKVNEEKE
jgi:hypothetical protein